MHERLRPSQAIWIVAESLESVIVDEAKVAETGFAVTGPFSGVKVGQVFEDGVDVAGWGRRRVDGSIGGGRGNEHLV